MVLVNGETSDARDVIVPSLVALEGCIDRLWSARQSGNSVVDSKIEGLVVDVFSDSNGFKNRIASLNNVDVRGAVSSVSSMPNQGLSFSTSSIYTRYADVAQLSGSEGTNTIASSTAETYYYLSTNLVVVKKLSFSSKWIGKVSFEHKGLSSDNRYISVWAYDVVAGMWVRVWGESKYSNTSYVVLDVTFTPVYANSVAVCARAPNGEYQYTRNLYVYDAVFSSSGSIETVTSTVSGTPYSWMVYSPVCYESANTSVSHTVSLDGGTTWETSVPLGSVGVVSGSGTDVRYKLELSTSDTSESVALRPGMVGIVWL